MPEKKNRTNCKCYCGLNPARSQHELALSAEPENSICSRQTMSNKSQYEFVKLKREYDRLPRTDEQGHGNFSRRNSTSTVATSATSSSSGSSSFSGGHMLALPEQASYAMQVNKLKYSNRRTFYEYLREMNGKNIDLATTDDKPVIACRPSTQRGAADVKRFDANHLRDLQEFRLRNRTECFSTVTH